MRSLLRAEVGRLFPDLKGHRAAAMQIAEKFDASDDAIVAVEPGFNFLASEYVDLFAVSGLTPFQLPRWQAAIHRDLVTPLGAKQHTVTVRRHGDGKLLAVLPLVSQKFGAVCFIQPADFGVCDANAVVGDPAVLEALASNPDIRRALVDTLKGASALLFRKIRRDGFNPHRLFDGAQSSAAENAAYHSDTGDDFDLWQRKKLNPNFTKWMAQLRRQIARDIGSFETRLATSEGEIDRAFAFLGRMKRHGRPQLLDDPVFASFYRNYAVEGAATGEAQCYVSTINDEPVAVLFGVGHADQCHMVIIGSDIERWGKYSPGMQIYFAVIKQRFDAGLQRLHFGLGNTGYKSRFRVEETRLDNFSVSRSPTGALLTAVYHRSKPLKNALRRFSQRLR